MTAARVGNVAWAAVAVVAGWATYAFFGSRIGLVVMALPILWCIWDLHGLWCTQDDIRDELDVARAQADTAREEAATARHAAADALRRVLAIEQWITSEADTAAGRHAHPVGEL